MNSSSINNSTTFSSSSTTRNQRGGVDAKDYKITHARERNDATESSSYDVSAVDFIPADC